MPIGYQLARLLHLPPDVIISKKIPHPLNEEFAIGSVCGDEIILEQEVDDPIAPAYIDQQIQRLKEEATAKYKLFRKGREPLSLKNKIVILIDDGVATGKTVLACVRNIRKQKPSKIVLAVPVASASAHRLLTAEVDELVCLQVPHYFRAVGEYYQNFLPVSDEEVVQFLRKSEMEISVVN